MKACIIGCSINGAYLAYRLAKGGHDVTVFEEKKEAGGKACSGLVSERLWDFVPKNEAIIENRIDSVEIRFPKRRVAADFKPAMLAINRAGLDRHVTKLAEEAGAKILFGHKAQRIICMKGSKPHVIAECGGRTIAREFDKVVGCDGANSKIREGLNVNSPSFRLGIYTTAKSRKSSNKAVVTPTPHGFKWKIPRGPETEHGVMERPDAASKLFKRLARGKGGKTFSAIIPEGLVLTKDKRFALCGDAAGLTKPWSGGGIIWGMTAADFLVKANLDTAKYNRMVRKHFNPKIFFSKAARTAVYWAGNNAPMLLPKNVFIESDWLY